MFVLRTSSFCTSQYFRSSNATMCIYTTFKFNIYWLLWYTIEPLRCNFEHIHWRWRCSSGPEKYDEQRVSRAVKFEGGREIQVDYLLWATRVRCLKVSQENLLFVQIWMFHAVVRTDFVPTHTWSELQSALLWCSGSACAGVKLHANVASAHPPA